MYRQDGTALLSVLVAVAVLGLVINGFMLVASNSLKAQRVIKLAGQKEDLRNIFRGSLICQTRCADLLPDIPQIINVWNIRATCPRDLPPVISVRTKEFENNAWTPLFPPGEERAVCRQVIAAQPAPPGGSPRPVCPYGFAVGSIDFAAQSISCKQVPVP